MHTENNELQKQLVTIDIAGEIVQLLNSDLPPNVRIYFGCLTQLVAYQGYILCTSYTDQENPESFVMQAIKTKVYQAKRNYCSKFLIIKVEVKHNVP